MRPFRFRPQPALDLRLRRKEQAEEAHARARGRLHAADQVRLAAEARAAAAVRESVDWHSDTALLRLEWHRNWMVGLERDVVRARSMLEERRIEERRAAELAREARMQVRVLERLKARTWRAWQLDARRDEQKTLDELAVLRFASRMRAGPETSE
jgi:flagellar biosynthesis chaperone FliJ